MIFPHLRFDYCLLAELTPNIHITVVDDTRSSLAFYLADFLEIQLQVTLNLDENLAYGWWSQLKYFKYLIILVLV